LNHRKLFTVLSGLIFLISLAGVAGCNTTLPPTSTVPITPGPAGTLQGTVQIGLETETSDIVLPYQPESYQPRKVMVYFQGSSDPVKQIDIDQYGKYQAELTPGVYTIDINHFENDSANNTPITVKIEPESHYLLDITITTDVAASPVSITPPEGSTLVKREFYYSGRSLWGDTLVAIEGTSQNLYAYNLKTHEKNIVLQIPASVTASGAVIYGNKIVWQSVPSSEVMLGLLSSDIREGPNYDIFLYDMDTKETHQLTDNSRPQMSPNIDGDTVVWLDARNAPPNSSLPVDPVYDIYAYNIKSGMETRITSNTTAERYNGVGISGKYIVWSDVRHAGRQVPMTAEQFTEHPYNTEIYLYNLETSEERRITNNPRTDRMPVIDGNRIIWERDEAFQRNNIYMYDIETGLETQVTHSSFVWYGYSISGNRIVWGDNRASRGSTYDNLITNGEAPCADIYLYNINTKEETRLTGAREWEVWHSPVIFGNHLVFTRAHLVTAGAEPGMFTYVMDVP
jgi:beta propeller repeat protein